MSNINNLNRINDLRYLKITIKTELLNPSVRSNLLMRSPDMHIMVSRQWRTLAIFLKFTKQLCACPSKVRDPEEFFDSMQYKSYRVPCLCVCRVLSCSNTVGTQGWKGYRGITITIHNKK